VNKSSVQVSYKKQVTLGIIGVTILLLFIETIANVWWIAQIHCEFEGNEIFQNMNEIKKRQLCLDFYNIRTSGDEIIPDQSTDSITINSLGFRGVEFSSIKPPDTYRIFMVGGSTMFGTGATSDAATIPGHLQEIFDEKDFRFNIEVINSGIQGADSSTELKLIEQKLIKLSPDLVIIYDGWNDLRANHSPTDVKTNWDTICKYGKENYFDVIVVLQPIAGFGNKVLTTQELEYAQTGIDYTNNPLIKSLSNYQNYAKMLTEIKTCMATVDLRGVFDTETEPIYWDQGHVSDQGNNIVAKSLFSIISPVVSIGNGLDTFGDKKNTSKASSLVYDEREIVVNVELLDSIDTKSEKIKISTHDNTNYSTIKNVTYFLSISKDNENLLKDYFFAEDGILIITIEPNNELPTRVIGEKQYDNNAYVMPGSKYDPATSGESLTSTTPIRITGPIFDTEGIYNFDIELRTIDNRQNWVFSLSGFHSQISIEKDTVVEETFTESKSSFQTEDFFRKLFSYYKTPILLNEIFR